jgi:SOS response associated peptidase (SRAP)
MIHAKSETASAKPAFRDGLKSRRGLIPADGFYEWARAGKAKQPYCFEVNDGEWFAFGGIWDRWEGRERNDARDLLDPDGRSGPSAPARRLNPFSLAVVPRERSFLAQHNSGFDEYRPVGRHIAGNECQTCKEQRSTQQQHRIRCARACHRGEQSRQHAHGSPGRA